jgi:epoxide hydrolase
MAPHSSANAAPVPSASAASSSRARLVATVLAWSCPSTRSLIDWTDPTVELPEDAVDRDQLLTNVSIFWFTEASASSAHAVCDGMQAWRAMAAAQPEAAGAPEHAQPSPPTGVAVFAADTTIRSVMDPTGRIQHWSDFDRGGHFAAMEAPDLLAADIQSFFRGCR